MNVDQEFQGQETPPGTPFDDGFIPSTTIGHTSADPTGGVHTGSVFTSLYTESQATNHVNVNTNKQPPTPTTIHDAKMAAAAAAAAAEAAASAATIDVEMKATGEMEAEAAATDAADLIARIATEA